MDIASSLFPEPVLRWRSTKFHPGRRKLEDEVAACAVRRAFRLKRTRNIFQSSFPRSLLSSLPPARWHFSSISSSSSSSFFCLSLSEPLKRLRRVYSSWKDGIFLFIAESILVTKTNSPLLFIAKELYIFAILPYLRIFQGNKTNEYALESNGNCSKKSDAIDTMRKQIKFVSNHFNFANIWFFSSFYESMEIQVLFSAFWIFNGIIFK